METVTFFRCNTRTLVLCSVCAMQLPTLSLSAAQEQPADRITALAQDRIPLAQSGQCERRAGPFATQDTAWQRWRQARNQGMAVSQGVVPCYDQYGTRGYCFNVFYPC